MKIDKSNTYGVKGLFKAFSKGQKWYGSAIKDYGLTGVSIKLIQHIRSE
jgi:tRNA nucleotidyltransferase (CCA-adding enzyme)